MSPADEAINPNRQTITQRQERSTPTVRRMSSDGSDQLQSPDGCPAGEGLITPTAGLDRGRRTSVNSVVSARAASCGELGQVRFGSIPSWATGGERIILQSDPCNRDRAPRFLWSETLEKAKQCSHYHRSRRRKRGPARPPRRIAAKSFTKVACKVFAPRPGYRHNSRRLSVFRSSRFFSALRVS